MGKILIVEDDEYIRESIDRLLKQSGYETVTADSVNAAQKAAEDKERFDLYLLDIILPDGSGFDICRQFREITQAPIIFLTSCDDEEDITKGLDMGADDYITKPFRAAELMSRIRANLRRMDYSREILKNVSNISSQKAENFVDKDRIVIDLDRHEVTKEGNAISLTPLEYELLGLLVANRGLIVKRTTILEKLWDSSGNFVEDSTLTVAVSRLKSKLGTDSKGKAYIETIRGYGYRWIDETTRLFKEKEHGY